MTFVIYPLCLGIISSFMHRLKSQTSQMLNWANSLLGREDGFVHAGRTLTRDQFNMRKLIVVATKSGKVSLLGKTLY